MAETREASLYAAIKTLQSRNTPDAPVHKDGKAMIAGQRTLRVSKTRRKSSTMVEKEGKALYEGWEC